MNGPRERLRVREAIVVEGRCDKAKLSSLVDGVIIETGGFRIFKDREQMELIRLLAARRGVVVLTDGDGAGFVIRRRLSQCLPRERVKHAYIPDIPGKERRKAQPSKEGKLGVEGMTLPVLEECLRRAGATILDEEPTEKASGELTKADLYELGLSGSQDSAGLRKRVQLSLGLPERLSANGFLQALNGLYGREDALERIREAVKEVHDVDI